MSDPDHDDRPVRVEIVRRPYPEKGSEEEDLILTIDAWIFIIGAIIAIVYGIFDL